ncbi:MAG: hypothetical protein AAGJ93_11560, partial [Bacteroidota bacterium]
MDKGKNNNIDKIIRCKLKGLTPQPKRGSWEQLSKRLDAAEQAEVFDNVIGERIEEIKVPYQSSSWALLAARLELERMRMRAIVHYKAMETSLLLLLFITAWQLLPIPATTPLSPTIDSTLPIAAILTPNDAKATSSTAVVGTASNEEHSHPTLPQNATNQETT